MVVHERVAVGPVTALEEPPNTLYGACTDHSHYTERSDHTESAVRARPVWVLARHLRAVVPRVVEDQRPAVECGRQVRHHRRDGGLGAA